MDGGIGPAGVAITVAQGSIFRVGRKFAGWCARCALPFAEGDHLKIEERDPKPNRIVHWLCPRAPKGKA